MTTHELLDQVATEALAGRRVHVDDVRALARRRRLRRVRVVALVAACLLVALPVAGLVVARARLSGLAQPAAPSGRVGSGVLPDRLPRLHTDPTALVDGSGRVRADRLSMAFVATLAGQEAAYGVDGDSGRVLRLPVLGEPLAGLPPLPTGSELGSVTLAAVSLSPDGRTVAVAYRDATSAYDLVLDLATGRASSAVQQVATGAAHQPVLAVAAVDGGRFVVPSDDLTGVRVLSVDGRGQGEVALPGLEASRGLVLDPQADGTVMVGASEQARPWLWVVDPAAVTTGRGARGIPAPVPVWSGTQVDDGGGLVALAADGTLTTRGDDSVGHQLLPLGAAADRLRVVSASGGQVLVVDDARQKVAQLVDVDRARTLSQLQDDGTLRPLTRLVDEDGDGTASTVVAQHVVAGARVVPAHDDPWYLRHDVQLWFAALAALLLLGAAMVPRGHRPR